VVSGEVVMTVLFVWLRGEMVHASCMNNAKYSFVTFTCSAMI